MAISVYNTLPAAARDQLALTTIPSMNLISHTIEDVVLQTPNPGTLYVGFQRVSFFLRQEQRYRQLAAHCEHIYVCVVVDVPPPTIANVTFVPLNPQGDLTREWFLITDSPRLSTALIARQTDVTPGAPRQFTAVWTYDLAAVEAAAAAVAQFTGTERRGEFVRDAAQQQIKMLQIARQLMENQERRVAQQAVSRHRTALLTAALATSDAALLLVDTRSTVVASTPGAAQLLSVPAERIIDQPLSTVGGLGLAEVVTGFRNGAVSAMLTTASGRTLRAASRQITDVAERTIGWVVVLVDATENERGALLQLVRAIQPTIQELREIAALLPTFQARDDWQRMLSRNVTRLADHVNARLQRLELLQQITSETVSGEVTVEVAELIAELAAEFQPQAAGRGVILTTDMPPDVQLQGDPGQLRLALRELIQNALQSSAHGGRVTLTAARQGNYLELRVSDTGHGIPLARQSQIFEPFYRRSEVDRSTNGGLGLALVCAVAQAHAGYVGLESVQHSGTDVTLLLPAQPNGVLYLRDM